MDRFPSSGSLSEGLKTAGYVDGQNVKVEVRWADGRYDQVPALAAEIAATRPDLIVAVGGNPVAVAAKQATSTIPVVFGAGADPVAIGVVSNLNRPDGNLTGMTLSAQDLDAKRLELLHDLVPQAQSVALLVNPNNPGANEELRLTREAATALKLKLEILKASSSSDIERAAGRVAGVRPGCAVAVRLDAGHSRETFAVAVESNAWQDPVEVRRIEHEVAHEVVTEVDVRPRNVVVLGPGTIPKTPSGKLRRANSVSLVL